MERKGENKLVWLSVHSYIVNCSCVEYIIQDPGAAIYPIGYIDVHVNTNERSGLAPTFACSPTCRFAFTARR